MGEILTLPELQAAELNGAPLKVVATTSVIGDVVAQVGGEAIELTTLMGPGKDPHSYDPGARELTAVAEAHVIFINGWDLEEGMVDDLERIGQGVPLVPISANIEPLAFDKEEQGSGPEQDNEEEHGHGGADPHVWFSIQNVKQWVENVERVLSTLDPANGELYAGNAAAYLAELDALAAYTASRLAEIDEDNRYLVTNHDVFSYFAQEYGFTVLGTVLPSASTLSEPSAREMTRLVQEMEAHDVCTIFAETTVSDSLARTIAGELRTCDTVQVLQLYTGALGLPGSEADNYIGMFRANVDMIVEGLQ